MKALKLAVLMMWLGLAVAGQNKATVTRVVTLPKGPITRIVSPDRKWSLVLECPDYSTPRLWIEQRGTRNRRLVKQYERSLSVGWAPNSRRFFVTDAFASNGTSSDVYDAATLKEISLADVLVSRDPQAGEYLGAGHSYLAAKRWLSSHELLVALYGHFDEQRRGFELKYRIDINGKVRRLYRHDDKFRRSRRVVN